MGEPVVGSLALLPVDQLLLEEAELVVDAVAEPRHAEGREGVEEAGRQASQAAVPEGGVAFLRQHRVERALPLLEELLGLVPEPEVEEVVLQGAADQELHRQVVDPLDVPLDVPALGVEPDVGQALPHGQRQGPAEVGGRSRIRLFADRVLQMEPDVVSEHRYLPRAARKGPMPCYARPGRHPVAEVAPGQSYLQFSGFYRFLLTPPVPPPDTPAHDGPDPRSLDVLSGEREGGPV